MTQRLLTINEAASYLRMSRAELMAHVARGEIGHLRWDTKTVTCERRRRGQVERLQYQRSHWRFRQDDLDAWVASRYRPPRHAPVAAPVARASGGPKPWEVIARKNRRFA